MNAYGKDLESFCMPTQLLSNKTIYQLGIKLIDILQEVHHSGIIYNNLKLENILIGNHDGSGLHKIRLCEFGFATKYVDKDGKHLTKQDCDVFRSNILFASLNQFNFMCTSRRDDMLSLCYFLSYLLKRGQVGFQAPAEMDDSRELFRYTKKKKM